MTSFEKVLAAGASAVFSPASHKAAAIGIGTLARSCSRNGSASGTDGSIDLDDTLGALTQTPAAVAAEKGRWSDLEMWLDCSLSTLEACIQCVNWTSSVGYIAGLAYVRLFSLIQRLLCPMVERDEDDGSHNSNNGIADQLYFGGQNDATAGVKGKARALDEDTGGEGRLRWARERLAQVVDDLMWRLREGLPGRDIRLRLLQVTQT